MPALAWEELPLGLSVGSDVAMWRMNLNQLSNFWVDETEHVPDLLSDLLQRSRVAACKGGSSLLVHFCSMVLPGAAAERVLSPPVW